MDAAALITAVIALGASIIGWWRALAVARTEAALRVQGELRLRLFTQAAASTEEALRACQRTFRILQELAVAWIGDNGERISKLLRETADAGAALKEAGAFVPPVLDDQLREMVQGHEHTLSLIMDTKRGSHPVPALENALEPARAAVEQFANAVREWKAIEWKRAEAGFPDSDTPEAQETR